jgi:hypothetical protein
MPRGASDEDDVERDTTYLHHPFLDSAHYQRALVYLRPKRSARTLPRPSAPRPQVSWMDDLFEKVGVEEWYQHGFTDADRDMWVQHGLSRYNAALASQCLSLGLPPAALQLPLDGELVADHLRRGVPVEVVLARLRERADPQPLRAPPSAG